MSNLGRDSCSRNMGSPFFHEFKKQASFFLKEKIKSARLALADVTPAQLLAEEATSDNPGAPETRILKIISRAAFEIDDYLRIVKILHKRFANFDKRSWRTSYNSLIVLEHMLTHGPESVAEEFQEDKDVIMQTGSLQHVDEKGFNWGLTVRNKSERILKLIENRPLLKEERNKARTVSRGIEGFGSITFATGSDHGILQESSKNKYVKCNSLFSNYRHDDEDNNSDINSPYPTTAKFGISEDTNGQNPISGKTLITLNSFQQMSFKENMAPIEERVLYEKDDFEEWNSKGESDHLLKESSPKAKLNTISFDDEHPFNHSEHQSNASLLSMTDRIMQAC